MKTLILAIISTLAVNAFALPKEINCKAESGKNLTFNRVSGELVVLDAEGETLDDLDSLTLGKAAFGETFPPVKITPIIHGEEDSDEPALAVIFESKTGIKVEMDGEIYKCN
jgi:hypothetical protein